LVAVVLVEIIHLETLVAAVVLVVLYQIALHLLLKHIQ
tara:strand:- start:658 stop:771 length:114 start_codon:yes stop_codon:yes gene_type:complete